MSRNAYNTRRKSADQLEVELVGTQRINILNDIINEINLENGEYPKQHWMLVGPRGSGKSHILSLLYHKIKANQNLNKQWICVLFPEELRLANDLSKFLERTIIEIANELENDQKQIAAKIRLEINNIRTIPQNERVNYLFELLNWIHKTANKYILLIIENLQTLLGKKLNLVEQKKLRAFLQTYNNVLLIGSSLTVFDVLHDHSQPFYHFFHIQRLNDLEFGELKQLIIKLLLESNHMEMIDVINKNDARIRALFTFTGGNPRMAVFLTEILKTEQPAQMLNLMDGILDELNPYFESILNEIPDYMEQIMNTLAVYEPAQSPKEIADHLEMPQNRIRNYVMQMKDTGYLRVAFSRGKSNYYCLSEYLYRIWYQMRDSSHREETQWVMELLMILYSPTVIKETKEKLDNCTTASTYDTLIIETARFIDLNPKWCEVIELCIDSMTIEQADQKIINKKKEELLQKANDQRKNGHITEALSTYSKILTKHPRLLSAQYGVSLCLYILKRIDESIMMLENIIQNNPSYYSAYGLLGDCLKEQGLFAAAEENYKKVIEIEPDFYYAYYSLGDCYADMKRYDESIEMFQKAINIDPKQAEAYWGWGDCLRSIELYDEAIIKFKKAIEIGSSNINMISASYGAWADCLRAQKRYVEANEIYKKATELSPNYLDAYRCWGVNLNIQGSYEEAIEKFKLALKIDPNDEGANVGMGTSLQKMGREAEAIKVYENALKINPDLEFAFSELIKLLNKKEEYSKVIQFASQRGIDRINNCSDIINIGESLLKTGNYNSAIQQLNKVVNLHNDCGSGHMYRGIALEKLGDKEGAILAFLEGMMYLSDKYNNNWDFYETYKVTIQPIINTLQPEEYIRRFYLNDGEEKFSKQNICMYLLLLDKYDVVDAFFKEYLPRLSIRGIEEGNKKLDILTFAIMLNLWVKLLENKHFEAIKLASFYGDYIRSLNIEEQQSEKVSKLIISLFQLQIRMDGNSENIHKILEYFEESKLPFNKIFAKIETCLFKPESIEAQRFLSDKATAELVKQINTIEINELSSCWKI